MILNLKECNESNHYIEIDGISLYTFLKISPRKIHILKKTKLGPREHNKIDDMNIKKMLLNLTNILKFTTKFQKNEKNKSAQNFLY